MGKADERVGYKAFLLQQSIPSFLQMSLEIQLLHKPHIMLDHDPDEVFEGSLAGVPAEECLGLGGVAEQLLHLCRTEEAWVDLDQALARSDVDASLVDAFAFPA